MPRLQAIAESTLFHHLPAAFEGLYVRLRPVARSDHPQLFAQRIDMRTLHLYAQGAAIPDFERWESKELPELLNAGPVMVIEDKQGGFLGLFRLHRLDLRSERSNLEFRLPAEMDDGAVAEAMLATLDYAFTFFKLRKVYVELASFNDVLIERLHRFEFEEEVRLKDYIWHSGRYADLIHLSLLRVTWEQVRERFVASIEISMMAASSPQD